MKIAVVHWLVNDVGGINSWTENIVQGLKSMGHVVQVYYGTGQRSLACDPNRKVPRSRRFHLLPAIHLSYRSEFLTSSLKTLNSYDLILFAHPSPHPTKSNTGVDHERNWHHFYKSTKPFKISVFHDRHWDRTNPWIVEVKDSVNYAHAAQHHFLPVVKKFAGSLIKCGWSLFPLQLKPKPTFESKARRIVVPTQWLAIKNHRFLLPCLKELRIPVHSYGSGQTYHKLLPLMKQVYKEDHHQDRVEIYNRASPHIHFGHVEYSSLMQQISSSLFSLDMSIQGMTNMTHWEPLTVGTISLIESRVVEDDYCEIPEDCCMSFQLDNLLEDLQKIAYTSRRELSKISERAWQFVQKCDCKSVANSILEQSGVL